MTYSNAVEVHAACRPLAWLIGRWEGNGHGDYPTIERFSFRQEVAFAHDGRPFLHYFSRTWVLDQDGQITRPGAIETGFWRPQGETEVEVVLAHPTGFSEVWYGEVSSTRVELATDVVARTKSAKEYSAGHRLYGLVNDELLWTYDMAAVGRPLQSHLWARLLRAA